MMAPVYWPQITSGTRVVWGTTAVIDIEALFDAYHRRVITLLSSLDRQYWRSVHAQLRREIASLDDNTDLYVLLRVSRWEQRERLKGPISGALWMRHMAEIIRRGFEEAHGVQWPEEY